MIEVKKIHVGWTQSKIWVESLFCPLPFVILSLFLSCELLKRNRYSIQNSELFMLIVAQNKLFAHSTVQLGVNQCGEEMQ